MKNVYAFAILLYSSQFAYSQTPFYPTANASGQQFGRAVDIEGSEIIVSSQSFSLFPVTQGSVYLFEQIDGVITQTEHFMPANVALQDGFGTGVSIESDFIAIGSPHHDGVGCTYIYKKNGADWEFFQQLDSPQPNPGAQFGKPVLSGNFLFISAIAGETNGQPTDTDSGFLYIYTFIGTQWTLVQTYGNAGSLNFGEQIRVQDDVLIVSSIGQSSSKIFHRFSLVGGVWQFAGLSTEFGSLEQSVTDFQIADNKLYLISRTQQNQQIQIIDYTTWELLSTVDLPQDDQIYTSMAVGADKMFVGSSGYVLQMMRKFPVQYFKKNGSEWLYEYPLYGTADEYEDDYFGQAMAMEGENLVVGAPQEGAVLPTGKAYYINTEALSTFDFISTTARLSPNPVSESFTILTDGLAAHDKIEIYSIHGQLLSTVGRNATEIDVSTLANGLYFAKMQHFNGATQTFKFIKN